MQDGYELLKTAWHSDRERENSLQLLFLAWMHWAEPDFLTGLSEDAEAKDLWFSIYEYFGGEVASDAEFLFVASLMASIFPWALGDVSGWEARANRMAARSLQLRPEGFSTQAFAGRSDYGDYFIIHARPCSDAID